MGQHLELIPDAAFTAQMMVSVKHNTTELRLTVHFQCFWASVPIYQCSLFTTKISILLQYRRVFATTRLRLACAILLGFIVVYGAWSVASAWANCVPIARFWDPSIPGFCFDRKALWFSNSAIHILTDLMILVYPMPVLKSLQLPRRQKMALMGVFALGGL